ncbi:MAG: 5-methylcytosine-specific restriction enzyme [Frankiaceae bacterium]|jgi:5-methylcytosine-specific restriction protein B|nr:5-methylcytosine-specific restriction enzyme [Frankiaceae bacterium]
MAEITRRRIGELQRAVFQVLMDEPGGLAVKEVTERAEELCPATAFENEDYPSQPGQRRYPKMLRFATITSVKAGWLMKEKGVWRLTDDGRQAYLQLDDPEQFEKTAIEKYAAWKAADASNYDAQEAAADVEAAALAKSTSRLRRAWLVRGANVDGTNVLPLWFSQGYCSITADVPDIARGTAKAVIAKHVSESAPEATAIAQGLYVGILNRFINDMDVDDVVVTVDGNNVYVGVVTGDPTYVPNELLTNRRRAVKWANTDSPFARGALSSDAADRLRGQLTVSDLTQSLPEFARLGGVELDAVEEVAGTASDIDIALPAPDTLLAEQLFFPLDWLRETVELLNEKRQIVLYGPPGTGKTFLAQELCKALVEGGGGEYEVVQFHPSYAYEDFFEGLRPRLSQDGSGAVTFELVHGPLRRMATLAKKNPGKPFVLIIDEINRANLAKVFGELYFLLEYRGQSVNLQYSDEAFSLPRNLFLIGTMNTADRSIALVDAAMRRRFYFQSLFPTAEPVRSVLPQWLASRDLPTEPAELLVALNDAIDDPDFAIGPSYLMSHALRNPGGLERIWRTAIVPLLAEHYFGEGRDIEAEFGLAALRKVLSKNLSEREALDQPAAPSTNQEPTT